MHGGAVDGARAGGGNQMRQTMLPRLRLLPWTRIVLVALLVGFGVYVGALHTWLESQGSGGLWPANVFLDLITAALAGLFALVGIIATATGRPAGPRLLVAVLAFGIGWGGGATFGPRWQSPRDVLGSVDVQLLVPVRADLSAPAICTTEANGDRITSVSAQGLGAVGVDELGLRFDIAFGASFQLRVNGLFGYEGSLADLETGLDTLTGRASFEGEADRARIGGPAGSPTVSGTLEWSCSAPTSGDGGSQPDESQPGGPQPEPTPLVIPDAIQGYFDLHGLVEWVTCPDTGPCQPYGHASGPCSSALDLRTDSIETVVPWTKERQARLVVVPGTQTATLTVTLDDGSPAETVTAPVVLTVKGGGGHMATRAIEGAFNLADGTLNLYVEWDCGEAFEQPPS